MNANWNLDNLRKIAGLPLTEAWDDGDDDGEEDPDVKIAGEDKRQQKFEKKNKKDLSTAEKEAAALKNKKAAAKPAEKKPEPAKAEEKKPEPAKSEEKPAEKKEEPKKDETPAEAKRRGAKPNPESKSQRAAAWIAANKSASRGTFLKWAKENLEMGSAYGSAFFARHNPKKSREAQVAKECWVITHPSMPSFLLAENREINQMQWIDPSSPMEPMVFNTLAEATKTATYMQQWKSQYSNIEKITLDL